MKRGRMLGLTVMAGAFFWLSPVRGEEEVSVGKALALWREGQRETAWEHLGLLLAQEPRNLEARFWRARFAFERGEWLQAQRDWQEVLERKPTSAESHYWLARLYLEAGEEELAEEHARRALQLRPAWREAESLLRRAQEQRPPKALEGPQQILLRLGEGQEPLVAEARAQGMKVYDYTFSTAPTDWQPVSGEWEIVNRFACDPRWTFYGGWGPQVAAVWNKHRFAGDVVVEAYVAFKHGVRTGGWSYQPTDLCLTLCGDGRNPGSGYSFIYAGDHNRRTMIWRQERLLAATSEPRFLSPSLAQGFPPAEEFHRRWWRLEARRIGRQISFWIDGEKALEVEDPDPLWGGQVGIWTVRNGIMVARVRIFYRKELGGGPTVFLEEPSALPPPQPVSLGVPLAPKPLPGPAAVVHLTSSTHPALLNDFETDVGEWQRMEPSAVKVTRTAETAAVGRWALRLENRAPGGEFAVSAVRTGFDAVRMPRLAFFYRIPPEVKVNLFLRCQGKVLEAGFTAPPSTNRGTVYLGPLPQVQADGRWHRMEVNLLGLLRSVFPTLPTLTVQEIFFANWNDEDYLHAGFGGNPYGARWEVDHFALYGPGGPEAKVAWQTQPPLGKALPLLEFRWALGPQPEPPGAGTSQGEAHCVLPNLRPGLWWLNLECRPKDSPAEASFHAYPLWVDTEPPRVSLPAQKQWGGEPLRLAVQEASGLDVGSVRLQVGGETFDLSHPALRYDPKEESLLFEPNRTSLMWNDGEAVSFLLEPLADVGGQRMARPVAWQMVYRRALDRTPPFIASVEGNGKPWEEEFEEESQGMPSSQGVLVERSERAARGGRYGLRLLVQQNGATVSLPLTRGFDAARYRFVTFDYKIPPRFQGNLLVTFRGQYASLQLTDEDLTLPSLGPLPDFQPDGQWHRAFFDVFSLLRQAFPGLRDYTVQSLLLMDRGWMGNYAGTEVCFDNLRLLPIVGGEVRVKVQAQDVGGVEEKVLEAEPLQGGKKVESRFSEGEGSLRIPWNGWTRLRLWAKDRAGNASPPLEWQVWVDAQPPEVVEVKPAPGSRALPRFVSIRLRDEGGGDIDPASLQLQVGSLTLTAQYPALQYLPQRSEVRWYPTLMPRWERDLKDGRTLSLSLRAKDYAGNPLSEPFQWQFIWDSSQDKDGPWVQVWSGSHPLRYAATFEEDGEGWAPTWKGSAQLERDTATKAVGSGSLRVTALAEAPLDVSIPFPMEGERVLFPLQARPSRAPRPSTMLALSTIPTRTGWARNYLRIGPNTMLSFAYCFPPQVRVDLWAAVSPARDPWRIIHLTDRDTSAPVLGRAIGMEADGKWHWACIPIGQLLQQDRWGQRGILYGLRLVDGGERSTPAGTSFWIDHWMLHDAGPAQAQLEAEAFDENGVRVYRYWLLSSPQPSPLRFEEAEALPKTLPLLRGLCFLHLQAVDGHGNASPLLCYPFFVR